MATPIILHEINVGAAPNDGTGATLRDAFITTNTNFGNIELFLANVSTNTEFTSIIVNTSIQTDEIQANLANLTEIVSTLANLTTISTEGITVGGAGITNSTSPITGAVTIAGGLGVTYDVHVGGSIYTVGGIQSDTLHVSSPIDSVSPSTGAATIVGGLGVGADVFVGGTLNVATNLVVPSATISNLTTNSIIVPSTTTTNLTAGTLTVTNDAQINGNLGVGSNAQFGSNVDIAGNLFAYNGTINDLEATVIETTDLVVSGNIGVGTNVLVSGTLSVGGATSLHNSLSVGISIASPLAVITDINSTSINVNTLSVTDHAIVNGELTVATDLDVLGGVAVTGHIEIPLLPTEPIHATNKSYVDALASGMSWRNAVVDPSLVDLVSINPPTPAATYGLSPGENVSLLATAAFTASYGTGATVSVSPGDILNLLVTSAGNGDYTVINSPLAVGNRFILGAKSGSLSGIATGSFGAMVVDGFALRKGDLIQLVAGDGTDAAHWSTPEGRGGLGGGASKISQGATVLCSDPDSLLYGRTYLYNQDTAAWVEISGPGSIGAGTGLSYSGSVLNVNGVQPQITSVGTLSSLAVTGAVTGASFTGAHNGTVGATTPAAGAFTTITGTLQTAAQPNITSLGTLTGLATAGHITTTGTSTYNIGTAANRFNDIFGTTFSGVATSANYADLAEKYQADKDYSAGTVLVFGGERDVTESTTFADVSVAGAVSTNPAYLMNDLEVDAVPVALRGKVPVLVVGPVTKGDLLVTSETPGCAVSVQKDAAFGIAVFAKAIETNLEAGIKLVAAVIV